MTIRSTLTTRVMLAHNQSARDSRFILSIGDGNGYQIGQRAGLFVEISGGEILVATYRCICSGTINAVWRRIPEKNENKSYRKTTWNSSAIYPKI